MIKQFSILLLLLFALENLTFSQVTDTIKSSLYIIELNQFFTGSGFTTGTELYFTIMPDHKKSLSIGLYFSPESKTFSGITVHHNRFLGRSLNIKTIRLNPYVFYNMIYRRTIMNEVLSDVEESGNKVTYKSIENHIGAGMKVFMNPHLFLTSEIGYGVYFGSIKKPSDPNPATGEICGTNGFGYISKFGIGYVF
jgi:hypothetical protein